MQWGRNKAVRNLSLLWKPVNSDSKKWLTSRQTYELIELSRISKPTCSESSPISRTFFDYNQKLKKECFTMADTSMYILLSFWSPREPSHIQLMNCFLKNFKSNCSYKFAISTCRTLQGLQSHLTRKEPMLCKNKSTFQFEFFFHKRTIYDVFCVQIS